MTAARKGTIWAPRTRLREFRRTRGSPFVAVFRAQGFYALGATYALSMPEKYHDARAPGPAVSHSVRWCTCP